MTANLRKKFNSWADSLGLYPTYALWLAWLDGYNQAKKKNELSVLP